MLFSSFVFLCFSCSDSETCNDEILGTWSYQVLSSPDTGGIHVSGGSTSDARIEKVEDIDENTVLLESSATVTDGGTCISGFKFLYNMEATQVEAIEEVVFGCDTMIVWDKPVLDLILEIDPLSFEMTNVSGEIRGYIKEPATNRKEILFVFDEIPICFE